MYTSNWVHTTRFQNNLQYAQSRNVQKPNIFFLSFGSNTLLDTIVSKNICFKNYTLFRKSYDLATIFYFDKDIYSVIKFSPGTPVSSTNKTDCHNITEILLKVALNTINQTNKLYILLVQLIDQISN